MKYFKRLLGCLLAGVMTFTLAACEQQAPPQSGTPALRRELQVSSSGMETQPAESSRSEAAEQAPDGEDGKTLVVYYSATGSTRAVAGHIADVLGADVFELIPAQPYTSADLNWSDASSRVSREHDDPSLRTVELTSVNVENWESYDTVFVGYPIWWGIAAWPVDGFVTTNDFSGKTVIPFCTSSSSGLGESGRLLAGMAGTGDWKEGRRFSGSVDEAEVAEWVNGPGLTE